MLYYGPPGTMIGKPIDLQVDPRNPDRVFANNYGGGNFLTEDGGKTWTIASQGYTGAEVWVVAVDPVDPHRVFANAKSGPFRSDDGGANWRGIQFPPMMLDVQGGLALDPSDRGRVLLGDMNSGEIFRSTTGGRSWDLVFQETRVNRPCMIDDCNGFRAFAFAPSNPNIVYAGMRRQVLSIDAGNPGASFGVYKSVDRGETWAPTNDAQSAQQDVNALVVDPRSADAAYVGTVARGGLYKTTDGGDHWLRSGYGMDPQASVRALAIDPTDSKVIYAGDALTGVYRSQDAGQTWEQINQGLRTRAVMALAISSDGGTELVNDFETPARII